MCEMACLLRLAILPKRTSWNDYTGECEVLAVMKPLRKHGSNPSVSMAITPPEASQFAVRPCSGYRGLGVFGK
jgi:hypothetical protein